MDFNYVQNQFELEFQRKVIEMQDENHKYDYNQSIFVIDSIRKDFQIDAIRDSYSAAKVTHVHLSLSDNERKERFYERNRDIDVDKKYEEIIKSEDPKMLENLEATSDILINAEYSNEDDILVRVISHIGLYGRRDVGYVDVIVGGQYGSEGKGQIAAHISKEYDLLVRVGGPNAGHTVFAKPKKIILFHLPSGTISSGTPLLLGPGSVIDENKLLKEISEHKVDVDRLKIDRQAIIINEEDKKNESDLGDDIASTKKGVGMATARKITLRGKDDVILAKHCVSLKPFLCDAVDIINETLARNGRILLEGTQGTGLSLHHGNYPYVTSRDTTVSGCLAESGIPPSVVRKVIMVCRTYPIRVQSPDGEGKTSGPLNDITWEIVAERSGKDAEKLKQNEKTSSTNRNRRVGEFDWKQLRKSSLLNRPTDIALNFTDYISVKNENAMRIDQLTVDTINMIEEVERVSGAKVSLIGTGFNARSIIDRRNWRDEWKQMI